MHGPELLARILQIKLQLDHSNTPEEMPALMEDLDATIDNLCLISKVTRANVIAVANKRYPAFLKEHCAQQDARRD